jgi:hypothetical protein
VRESKSLCVEILFFSSSIKMPTVGGMAAALRGEEEFDGGQRGGRRGLKQG